MESHVTSAERILLVFVEEFHDKEKKEATGAKTSIHGE